MGTTKFKNLKLYHNLAPWDVNRTDINSREDKYQDAVVARLEEKAKKPKNKSKRKK